MCLEELHALVGGLDRKVLRCILSDRDCNIWAKPRQKDLQKSLSWRGLAGYGSEKIHSGNIIKGRCGEGDDETILAIFLSGSWSREKQMSLEYTSGSHLY